MRPKAITATKAQLAALSAKNSIDQMAAILNCSRKSVLRYLHNYGIRSTKGRPRRTGRPSSADSDLGFKLDGKPTECLCPMCGIRHVMSLRWIGNGKPRKYCGDCRRVAANTGPEYTLLLPGDARGDWGVLQ